MAVRLWQKSCERMVDGSGPRRRINVPDRAADGADSTDAHSHIVVSLATWPVDQPTL